LVAQFLGGIVAAFVLVAILPDPANYGQTTGLLTADSVGNAVLLEAVRMICLMSSRTLSASSVGALLPG